MQQCCAFRTEGGRRKGGGRENKKQLPMSYRSLKEAITNLLQCKTFWLSKTFTRCKTVWLSKAFTGWVGAVAQLVEASACHHTSSNPTEVVYVNVWGNLLKPHILAIRIMLHVEVRRSHLGTLTKYKDLQLL